MMIARTPDFRLDGRRALVTGAGRGIGAACAAALAEAGADVVLASRTLAEVEARAAEIRGVGGKATGVALDVTDHNAVSRYCGDNPAFHILVNNAGTNRPMHMTDVSEADYDAVFGLNVRSTFFVTQACVRRMIRDGVNASLIHMGSQMGHVGGANRSIYCGSKWAIEGMSKAFALDLAPYNIRSNVIAPTFIETPLTKPFFANPAFRDEVQAKIKLGRLGKVEDIMGGTIFLASDASAMITGTSMLIDGGWTAE